MEMKWNNEKINRSEASTLGLFAHQQANVKKRELAPSSKFSNKEENRLKENKLYRRNETCRSSILQWHKKKKGKRTEKD